MTEFMSALLWHGHASCQHTSNEIGIRLARFVAEKLTSEATENAQNIIEEEPTVDRTLLKDLILQHTNDATKNLKTELNSLRNQLSNLKVKNTPKRGQRQGASNKNKKRNGDQTSTKNSAQRGRSSSPKRNKKKTPKGSANQGGSGKGSSTTNTASHKNGNKRKRSRSRKRQSSGESSRRN